MLDMGAAEPAGLDKSTAVAPTTIQVARMTLKTCFQVITQVTVR